ncbi:MAG: acetylglutamate kinase [Actinomycetota bacterium]
MKEASQKAAVLIEALPYIRRWAGKTIVVKFGGEIVEDPSSFESLITDIVLMRFVGIDVVLVHGAGPQISRAMRELGTEPRFIDGHRVTDVDTVNTVKSVMDGVRQQIVSALWQHGADGRGFAGEDMVTVRARDERLGFVGDVERIDAYSITKVLGFGIVPVVTPMGSGPGGIYNTNADIVAGALAGWLHATKIVFLTNVPGLYRDLGDEDSLVSEISVDHLEKLLEDGSLSDGMIPKITAAVEAMRSGVAQVHLLDGRVPHALLLEVFTDKGVGTMVLP